MAKIFELIIFRRLLDRSHVRILSKTLLSLYLLFLLWLILFKFSLDIPSVLEDQIRNFNLIPFAYSAADSLRHYLMELSLNFVVFVPLGLLLSVNFKQVTFWQKLAFICVFSLSAEVVQFALAIGVADVTDIITNTSGGFLGLMLYNLSNRYVDSEKLDRFIVISTMLIIVFISLRFLIFRHIRYQSAH